MASTKGECLASLDRLGSIIFHLADQLSRSRSDDVTANTQLGFLRGGLSNVHCELLRITKELDKNTALPHLLDGGSPIQANSPRINTQFKAQPDQPLLRARRGRLLALSDISTLSFDRRRPAPKTAPSSSSGDNRSHVDLPHSPPVSPPGSTRNSPRGAKHSNVEKVEYTTEHTKGYRSKHHRSTSSMSSHTPGDDYEAEVLDPNTPDPPHSCGRYQVKLSSIGGKKKEQVEKLVRTYNRVDRLGDNSKQQWCAPFIEVTTEVPGTASMKNPEHAERALSMRVILERVKKPVLSVV
ncbi:MAG: hypothetical protein MMC23_008922 [Stictis urceolatum]|nr:hypothetical protein [Stictis urceolata]